MRPGGVVPATVVGAVLLLGGCVGWKTESAAPVDAMAPGTWSILAPMPSARQEVAVAALDGRVYVIGGMASSLEAVATVEAYDPATNRWEARVPLPAPTHHAAAAAVGGRLFVIGGYTGGRVRWTAQQTVYEYDAQRNSWATRAAMPTARGGLAVAVLDGRIHALGGDHGKVTGAHEVYDPGTDRWSAANPLPHPREHLAAVGFQGRVWAIGGRDSFLGDQYANVDVYDPKTDSWRTAPPLPRGRGGLAAAALEDRFVVFGGETPVRIFSATEMYDPGGSRWIAKHPMPAPRHGIGAAVIGNRIYIPGGATRPGLAPTDVNHAFAP